MNVALSKILEESNDYCRRIAAEEKYGEIIVRITLNDGCPVKLEKSFCEHITRRSVNRYVVHK